MRDIALQEEGLILWAAPNPSLLVLTVCSELIGTAHARAPGLGERKLGNAASLRRFVQCLLPSSSLTFLRVNVFFPFPDINNTVAILHGFLGFVNVNALCRALTCFFSCNDLPPLLG